MKVENEMALPITKSVTVMLLEPYAGKLARTVLRGRGGSNAVLLPDTGNCDDAPGWPASSPTWIPACAWSRRCWPNSTTSG